MSRRPLQVLAFSLAAACLAGSPVASQTRRGQPARQAPMPIQEVAVAQCPAVLGTGVSTKLSFCDVLTGRDPSEGIVIAIPPHSGDVTLTFDLHNRHTYSEELVKTSRAYRRYLATIGVLTSNNDLLTRAVVLSEFRTAADLLDRVGGGAGPGGVKAVAPIGVESIVVTIPAAVTSVSILGEKLSVDSPEGTDMFTALGRPIAVVSNMMLEYLPPAPGRRGAPARRTTPAPTPTRPAPTQPR